MGENTWISEMLCLSLYFIFVAQHFQVVKVSAFNAFWEETTAVQAEKG